MRVCLDTNVLIKIFVPHPPFSTILDAILNGRITLLVSDEILFEYEEVIVREFGLARWQKIDAFFTAITRLHGAVATIEPHYRFTVITADPDDNKFIDCAVAGGAEYIVTYDKHFEALRNSGYTAQPIIPDDLVKRL
jgi:uncharacterized protein